MITNCVDVNYMIHKNLNYDNDQIENITIKDIWKMNPKFIIVKNDNIIYQKENIQTLYLYPLTLLDYANNLKSKNIIFMNLISISDDENYINIFSNKKFKNLKAVEILIKDDYDATQYSKIFELIDYFYKRKIKISLNIKNLLLLSDKFKEYFSFISYFKIFLPNILNNTLYDLFLQKLMLISNNVSSDTLVHIKTYLNIEQVLFYENAIKDFSKLKVDIFQVSKELIPIGFNNIEVNVNIQNIIRTLELKYNNYTTTKFISVKDISKLYYPRFELNDQNSKKCYACQMKPYLFNKRILPCKVQKIFENVDSWTANYNDIEKYNSITANCGKNCSDCASIFENDALADIEEFISKSDFKGLKFYLKGD